MNVSKSISISNNSTRTTALQRVMYITFRYKAEKIKLFNKEAEPAKHTTSLSTPTNSIQAIAHPFDLSNLSGSAQ